MGVTALLAMVIILGIRQYQLTERYNTIISQSEMMIFQFSTIREQITTALIEKDWEKIVNAADHLKELNSSVARFQENTLIPSEYRLDMARQIDLAGLVIASKEILSNGDEITKSLLLQDKLRTLADYLLQFDRIIVSQMRAKLVQFQTIMIGALGAVICLISFSLIFLYKKAMIPLIRLTAQTEDLQVLENGLVYDKYACTEVATFADSVNNLLRHISENQIPGTNTQGHSEQLATIINESNNLSNGIINYAQLLKDSYREADIGTEETKILQSIIEAAERIALLNKNI